MSTRNLILTVRPALGGLNISGDPSSIDPNELVIADNITYLESGQRKRRSGMLQYSPSSSSAGSSTNAMVSSSSNVRALADTWSYSTGTMNPVQRLVAVTGASIFRSTGNGLWTAVTGTSSFGVNSNLQTNIMLGQDHAVISDGRTQPIAYNLTATTLVSPTTGANWPIFESATFHQTRMVMTGISTAPSDIRVTAAGNIFDSTGVDAVTLPIDPGDGDRVIGTSQTFFRNLYVFKGPQFGSVHEISGNTSTAYTKNRITSGAPAHSQQGIITTPTDVYWISHYGVHSLQTTIKYGDVEQGFLSLPIQDLWRKRIITLEDIPNAKGFWNASRNVIGWIITPNGVTGAGARYWAIVYNYALSDPTPGGRKFWSLWKISRQAGANFGLTATALILNPAGGFQPTTIGEPHLYFGADNGMVYQGDYQYFDDDGQPYPVQIQTPYITRFKTPFGTVPESQEKQWTGITTYYAVPDSQTPSSMTYSVISDNRNAGTGSLTGSQAGGVLGSFILGTGILGGINFLYEESIIEGRGRGIQITWTNSLLDQDFEHLGYSVRFAAAEAEAMEPA